MRTNPLVPIRNSHNFFVKTTRARMIPGKEEDRSMAEAILYNLEG